MVTNYYYPYISGLSEVVRLVSERLVANGHEVTVLCSNHSKLPKQETINNVLVKRAPIICKISKGTISPSFIIDAVRMSKKMDIVNLHMPMLESGIISSFISHKKIILMYQCDVNLKAGLINRLIVKIMFYMNRWAMKNANKIMVSTLDYGLHSKLASFYKEKLVEVRTPIKEYYNTGRPKDTSVKTIGFCGRIVAEKGIDILLQAFETIIKNRSNVRLLIGGDYQSIAGGSIYPTLKKYIIDHKIKNVFFMGKIPENKMADFYSSLDVFCLPSTDPLEAFGMVQVEAMLCGIPVVASDLYGVRTIIQKTGMGLICKKGDPQSLSNCILTILETPERFKKTRDVIHGLYNTDLCVKAFTDCFTEAIQK